MQQTIHFYQSNKHINQHTLAILASWTGNCSPPSAFVLQMPSCDPFHGFPPSPAQSLSKTCSDVSLPQNKCVCLTPYTILICYLVSRLLGKEPIRQYLPLTYIINLVFPLKKICMYYMYVHVCAHGSQRLTLSVLLYYYLIFDTVLCLLLNWKLSNLAGLAGTPVL